MKSYPDRVTGTNAVIRWFLLVACCLFAIACGQEPPPDRLIEGRPFPRLVLHQFDDGERSIAEYQGRIVVLNVWATWCPPCRKELPDLERLHESLDPERFVVLGMSVDGNADIAQEYLLEHGITFENYIDLGGEIASEILEIRVYPDTFILSADGILLRKLVGERDWDDPGMIDALRSASHGDTSGLGGL